MPNLASVISFFPSPEEATVPMTLTSTITSGATTVPVTGLTNYTDGDIVVFTIEPTSATAKQVFTGSKSGSSVVNVVWTYGTNQPHTAGVTIIEYVSATTIGMITKGLLKQHTSAGAHKAITTDTMAATGNVSVAGTLTGAGYSMATMSNPYKFSAYLTGNQTVTASTLTKITFNTENFDTGSNFDNATNYRFVAPIAGFYSFNAKATNNGAGDFYIALYKNGTEVRDGTRTTIASGLTGGVVGDLLQLAANDYIEVFVYSGNTLVVAGSAATYFSGFLVSKT